MKFTITIDGQSFHCPEEITREAALRLLSIGQAVAVIRPIETAAIRRRKKSKEARA